MYESRYLAISLGLALGACSGEPGDADIFGSGVDSGTDTSSSTSGSTGATSGLTSASSGGSETTGNSADTGPLFDVGGATGGPSGCNDPDGECGCTAVDVLFVIDNSTSMRSYQQSLAAVAPSFADQLVTSLPPGTDLHVGVTTTSFYGGSGGTSPGETNCAPYYAGAGMTGRDDLYQYYWTPDGMPYAENGAQGRLYEHQGQRYFALDTGDDPSAMKAWLTGAITGVGESGSVWEMVAAGAAYPFHPANATANSEFLRDEGAVLVIFTLTDEVGNSPEDVAVYHDMVVAAKAGCGGDQCVVTGGIMQPCLETATDTRIHPFLASFGKDPVIADIGPELDDCFDDCESGDITFCNVAGVSCADLEAGLGTDYADALGETLAGVIAQTCEQIPPVG